jgi:glycerate 2-kinase
MQAEAVLAELFRAAVRAADPAAAVAGRLPPRPRGRTVVVGGGKAAAAMAAAVDAAWDGPLEGLVVTRDGHARDARPQRVEVAEARHPVPDARGAAAARRMLDLVSGTGPDDLVVALVSGGGSALLTLPPPGVPLDALERLAEDLLRSGADIAEMNAVRRHVGLAHGGRLALASGAPVATLAISDVPGDELATIASGPTVADPTTRADALAVLARRGVVPHPALAAWLADPASETPKPGDPRLARHRAELVASPMASLRAAAALARERGLEALVLGDAIEGEAREAGRVTAGIALSVRRHGVPVRAPAVLLSGGETTVTVRGDGRGGRNMEFALGCALALAGAAGIHGIAADTDGIDGRTDEAGALFGPDTLARARAAGVDPAAALVRNDARAVFAASGGLVGDGPTGTNVNDFRAILVAAEGEEGR